MFSRQEKADLLSNSLKSDSMHFADSPQAHIYAAKHSEIS